VRPGFVGLPVKSESWTEAKWDRWHTSQAEAIGCRYDKARADRFIMVAASHVHAGKPLSGQPFGFIPWYEHRVARPLYGYINPDTNLRRYQKVYLWTAKKQAKTTSVAPHIPYHLLFEGSGQQCFSAAGDKDQAGIVYNAVVPMYHNGDPSFRKLLDDKPTHKQVIAACTNSYYKVLSSEAPTKAGLDIAFLHFDELAFQPNRYLWDLLTQGSQAAQVEPVLMVTSTAGYDRNGVCFEEWEYSRRVLADPSLDPALLVVLYELPEGADWKDESMWGYANPSMGTMDDVRAGRATTSIEQMRVEFRKALEVPSNENIFRMMRLNQWMSQESRFIPMTAYDALASLEVMAMDGVDYYAGLDLSSTTDITAYVEMGLDDKHEPHIGAGTHFWLPGAGIEDRERRDHAPYREWAKQGYMTLTEGNIVDYRSIIEHVDRRTEAVGMPREIAFDPYSARQLCEVELPSKGYTTVPVRQGFISLSEPTKKLLEYIIGGTLHHGGNPVMRWMMDNAVATTDPAGNIKLDKGKATGRIDGVAALVNAIARAIVAQQPTESVYETRGLLTF
jgi:phage terminase large subunit-like protein